MLKCQIFGGKTGLFPLGLVFRVVRSIAMVQCQVELEPEPTREFGPIGNTSRTRPWLRASCHVEWRRMVELGSPWKLRLRRRVTIPQWWRKLIRGLPELSVFARCISSIII